MSVSTSKKGYSVTDGFFGLLSLVLLNAEIDLLVPRSHFPDPRPRTCRLNRKLAWFSSFISRPIHHRNPFLDTVGRQPL
ncbi:hypothetical protein BIW11_04567 [Tropilaelaps mercedesae]|uniref:Uncharacterized protein n=1 Tax=Tropilaelaps mercedesae TaxID=418985 RepID=A0A1V9X479_9ACAR|nr:hypothetical protein BIW11_04567 [Tropilaelaps mercedesae]